MQPLPTECQTENYTAKSSHAGLWYDRFFNQYTDECELPKDKSQASSAKQRWIETVTASPVGDPAALEDYSMRQRLLVEELKGSALQMSSEWNFVTGMGNNHPVENGFAWHHTLGVPYLTGAAVKGMLKGWCEAWAKDPKKMNSDTVKQWFGDTDQAGEIIFFDAVPIKPVKLIVDIMTHYGDWYAKGDQNQKPDGSNTPADWHDPIPIPFLAVAPKQYFQFAFAFRLGSNIQPIKVIDHLVEALEFMGAGAKTATGYGRFERDKRKEENFIQLDEKKKQKQQQEKEKREEQEAIQRSIHEEGVGGMKVEFMQAKLDGQWKEISKEEFVAMAEPWVARIEEAPNDVANSFIVDEISKFLDKRYLRIMENPNRKKGRKQANVYRDRPRNLAVRLNQLAKGNKE